MTITVTNTLERPDGTAWAYATVKIGLVGAGFASGGVQIQHVTKARSDATGLVTVALTPNNTGEAYVWTNPDRQQYTFQVPASGGPYTLQALLVTPAPAADPAVTQTAMAAYVTAQIGGQVAADVATSLTNYPTKANNLSDLASAATARTNLGLGDVAVHAAAEFARATGIYSPHDYGAVGNGTTDDSAAIQSAINDAFTAGGGTVLLRADKTYLITADIFVKGGVNLLSWGAGNGTAVAKILCSGSTARVRFGDGTATHARGGVSGGFLLEGNGAGNPAGLFYSNLNTSRTFQAITVNNGAGVGMLIEQTQNCAFIGVDATNNATVNLILDKGCGGNLFLRCENATAPVGLLVEATAAGPYTVPTHNEFIHCIFENYGASGTELLNVIAGDRIQFRTCIFSAGSATMTSGYLGLISGGANVQFDACSWAGAGTNGALKMSGSAGVTMTGRTSVSNCTTAWTVDTAAFGAIGPVTYASTTTHFATVNGGSWGNFSVANESPHLASIDDTAFTYALRVKKASDAGYRTNITPAGLIQSGDGTGFTAGGTLTPTANDWTVDKLRISGQLMITESQVAIPTNQAVTLNFAAASMFQYNLAANVSGATITNPKNGGELTISWVQDATGGRTYTWPATCKFAGGTAPSDTTASTRTTVRFHYDSGTAKWYEISRAVAVPA